METFISIHYDLIFNAFISAISAAANLYYVLRHANGKKNVRMVSVCIMIYFTIIQICAASGVISYATFGAEYLRPWMPVLYLIPVFDVIVDFRKKTKTAPKGG
jgi:hypothetical protein